MSKYSEISKSLGWERRDVPIPAVEKANELVKRAMRKDLEAFQELFLINRFSPPPQNGTEKTALEIVVDGFIRSSKFWTW